MRHTARSQNNVKVHLASQDVLTIAGLRQLLKLCSFINITGTSTDEATMVSALKHENPDVLVLNAGDELEVHTVVQAARKINESLKVVVLTDEATSVQLIATHQARLEGILIRGDDCLQDIGAVLRIVHQGGKVTSTYNEAKQDTDRQSNSPGLAEGAESLSPRETIILRELARGRTNAEIAKPLNVSVSTVKADLARIMNTVKASNRVDLAVLAVRSGLTEASQTQHDNPFNESPHRPGKRKSAADD